MPFILTPLLTLVLIALVLFVTNKPKEPILSVLTLRYYVAGLILTNDSQIITQAKEQERSCIYANLREAISNIIKYSQATRVSLSILSIDKYLSLTLKDNGIGFNVDKKRGKGLNVIQKKSTLHQCRGKLEAVTNARHKIYTDLSLWQ